MSGEQGPRLQAGDATVRDCRRTPTVSGLAPGQWIGGGAMNALYRLLGAPKLDLVWQSRTGPRHANRAHHAFRARIERLDLLAM